MELIYFIGRLHVLVLHIPIGIIVAILVLELLARKEKYRYLAAGSAFLWSAAAVSAVVTVAFGYMHFAEGGFDGPSGNQHRTFGTALAAIISVVALLRSSKFAANYAPVFFPASVLAVFLVSITGHYGGNLTHGSTFLVEYAPQPIRAIAGLGPRRPPVTNVADADPFLDIVAPLLEQRCSTCHNSDKRQGELDMSSYATLMRGGETGSVVVAGRPAMSEMLSRISLPPDDEAFMPAEGKTPLTDQQVQIIEWWIAAGIPVDVTMGSLATPPDSATEALIRAELGL
jgi:uncharacterized membrane protein